MYGVFTKSTMIVAALMLIAGSAFAGEVVSNNSKWAKDYPEQYESWKMTAKSDKIIDMLEEKPQLVILWAGYGFAKDYNAPRGHFYALQSNQNTSRTGAPVDEKTGPMPAACWTRHGQAVSNRAGC